MNNESHPVLNSAKWQFTITSFRCRGERKLCKQPNSSWREVLTLNLTNSIISRVWRGKEGEVFKKLLLVLPVFLLAFAPSKLIKTKVTKDITVMIPSELAPMANEDIAQRYPSVRAPLGAYTNADRLVDFSVNISATQWPDSNMGIAKKFFKSGITNLYDRVEFIDEGTREIGKKKFIFFELMSRVNGNKRQLGEQQTIQRYIYIQYLIEPKRTLVFTFSSPKEAKEEWQKIAKEVMKSISVK